MGEVLRSQLEAATAQSKAATAANTQKSQISALQQKVAKFTKAASWAQQGACNDSVLSQDEGMAAQKDAALTLTSLHVGKKGSGVLSSNTKSVAAGVKYAAAAKAASRDSKLKQSWATQLESDALSDRQAAAAYEARLRALESAAKTTQLQQVAPSAQPQQIQVLRSRLRSALLQRNSKPSVAPAALKAEKAAERAAVDSLASAMSTRRADQARLTTLESKLHSAQLTVAQGHEPSVSAAQLRQELRRAELTYKRSGVELRALRREGKGVEKTELSSD